MRTLFVSFLALVFSTAPLLAGDSDSSHESYSGQLLPPVIAAGMDVYAMEGAERAIETWMKGGPLETDEKVLGMAAVFTEVEARYGKYQGYRSIGQSTLSPESKIVYVQMNFEKGPLFLRFLCYKAGEKWVVAGRFIGNTDPTEVIKNIELDKITSS